MSTSTPPPNSPEATRSGHDRKQSLDTGDRPKKTPSKSDLAKEKEKDKDKRRKSDRSVRLDLTLSV